MGRSFGIVDLVQLPPLDASSAQTLGTAVLAAAGQYKKLPAQVDEAVDGVSTTLDTLNSVVVRRLPATPIVDGQRAKTADVAIDAGWSSVFSWATGWSKMPGLPEAEVAAGLIETLFPKGLKFTQLPYKLEWAESNTRLLLIDERGLEADFEKLGGEKLLARLRALHAAYGDALGITDVLAEETNVTTLRDALAAFIDALRVYVVRAASLLSPKDEKSTTMARALLAPIEQWETPGKAGGNADNEPAAEADAAKDATEAPAPAATAAPTEAPTPAATPPSPEAPAPTATSAPSGAKPTPK